MKNILKKGICLLLAVCLLIPANLIWAADATDNPTVFVIGDSTADSYDSGSERHGWGQVLHNFFKDSYMVENWAKAGESSHSFYDDEFLWGSLKTRIKEGDYVLIQFGHNDNSSSDSEGNDTTDYSYYSNPELPSSVVPPTTLEKDKSKYSYKWYLKQFIQTVHNAGAYPILVTSVERQKHINYSEENSSLYKYVKAMKELSSELADVSVMGEGNTISVPVIDIWTKVRASGQGDITAGETGSWYVSDGVHLNKEIGGMAVAKIFVDELKASNDSSAQELVTYLVSNALSVTHTELPSVINEDFEGYDLTKAETGVAVRPGIPWVMDGDATGTTEVKIVTENAGTENNVLGLFHGEENGGYLLKYTLFDTASSGYYRLKYRFKADADLYTFQTRIGSYKAGIRYKKGNVNGVTSTLTADNWYDIEFYMNMEDNILRIIFDDTDLKQDGWSLSDFSYIEIGFNSGTVTDQTNGPNKNSELYLDDIEFKEISEDEYNIAFGVLPSDITTMEDFEKAGTTATVTSAATNQEVTIINKTYWGWVNTRGTNSTHGGKRTITNIMDPDDTDNTVAKFESVAYELNDYNTLSFTPSTLLEDGIYSVKFRLRAQDSDSSNFWVSAMDTGNAHRHYIAFAMSDDETYGDKVYMMTTEDGVAVEYAKPYDFELGQWYDIEIVYDLTPEGKIAASVYVEGTKLINAVTIGGGDYTNDGTISRIDFGIPGGGRLDGTKYHTTATTLTGDDTVFASFLVDDIMIRSAKTNITGITQSGGNVTEISAYVGNSSKNQKFVVAVYEEGNTTKLKDVSFVKAETMGTQKIALTTPIAVTSGDKVRVYHWNLGELVPFGSAYETTIQ